MANTSVGRSDLVSYVVPAVPSLGLPAHSGALVLIPDGNGGSKPYGWFTAACSRIMAQDSAQLEVSFKQGTLSFGVFEKACKHLATTCGAPDIPSWQERLRIGSSMTAQYGSISHEEQIVWLRQDNELRKSFLPGLESLLASSRSVLTSAHLMQPQQRQIQLDEVAALEALIAWNQQQIAHINAMQSQILALLPSDRAARLALPPKLVTPEQRGPATEQTSMPQAVDDRKPLAVIPTNIVPQAAAAGKEDLKRKREDEAPTKPAAELISLLEESDDEDALLSQVDAINARIAAIRARTAHEDELMPSKKPKTNIKATKQPQPAAPLPNAVDTQPTRIKLKVQLGDKPSVGVDVTPGTSVRKVMDHAKTRFKIPKERNSHLHFCGNLFESDQKIRALGVKDGDTVDLLVYADYADLATGKTWSEHANRPKAAQKPPKLPKFADPSQAGNTWPPRTRLKIQVEGKPGVWVEPTPATTIQKVMEVARAQLKIPKKEVTFLSFRDQTYEGRQHISSLKANDGDTVNLICWGKPGDPAKVASSVKPTQKKSAATPSSASYQAGQQAVTQWYSEKSTDATRSPHWPHPACQAALPSPSSQMEKRLQNPRPMPTGPTMPPPVVDLTSDPTTNAAPHPPPAPRAEPTLCREQQEVVDLIMAGHNVFYTGSAGCGKSTVLKSFVPKLRELGKNVRIVAPTGKAALDINGSTTWTFAGWTPLHMKKPLKDLKAAAHGKFVRKRLWETDVLVIDEISMVENHLFERLNAIMKEARGDKERAFGGVQLIVTGDFCQLPPVKPFQYCITCGREQPRRMAAEGKVVYRCPQHGDCQDDDKWAFRSAAWEECKFKHINLTNIHRQSDEVFIKILQKLRVGNALTQSDRTLLIDHECDVENAVKLFPTRNEVTRINQTEFDKLKSDKRGYTCLDHFRWNEEKHPHLRSKGERQPFDGSLIALREHRLENFVELRKDMLVVLLVNLDISSGLVNGSQGKIVDFEPYDPAKLPKATFRDGPSSSKPSRSDFGSSSSHKHPRGRHARGDSMEPQDSYEKGELRGEYAAFREVQIREFIEGQTRNKSKMWPIVEFDNGLKRTIYADCQVNELGDEKEYTLLARTQIPLIAAWAMTIHKSQGMTLSRVIVDLGKSFEEGQEYVALSRARALDGLKVLSLGDGVGKGGNAQVKQFLWEKFKLR